MKRLCVIVAFATLLSACGWIGTNTSTQTTEESHEAQVPKAVDVDIMAEFENADVETMSVAERVDYYLSRYTYESSFEDKSSAETTHAEMIEWLQQLSDEDKRLADDASDAWYERNADRI